MNFWIGWSGDRQKKKPSSEMCTEPCGTCFRWKIYQQRLDMTTGSCCRGYHRSHIILWMIPLNLMFFSHWHYPLESRIASCRPAQKQILLVKSIYLSIYQVSLYISIIFYSFAMWFSQSCQVANGRANDVISLRNAAGLGSFPCGWVIHVS